MTSDQIMLLVFCLVVSGGVGTFVVATLNKFVIDRAHEDLYSAINVLVGRVDDLAAGMVEDRQSREKPTEVPPDVAVPPAHAELPTAPPPNAEPAVAAQTHIKEKYTTIGADEGRTCVRLTVGGHTFTLKAPVYADLSVVHAQRDRLVDAIHQIVKEVMALWLPTTSPDMEPFISKIGEKYTSMEILRNGDWQTRLLVGDDEFRIRTVNDDRYVVGMTRSRLAKAIQRIVEDVLAYAANERVVAQQKPVADAAAAADSSSKTTGKWPGTNWPSNSKPWPYDWPVYKQSWFDSYVSRCDTLVGLCRCGVVHVKGEFTYHAPSTTLFRHGHAVASLPRDRLNILGERIPWPVGTPRYTAAGQLQCDTWTGPCRCGSTHEKGEFQYAATTGEFFHRNVVVPQEQLKEVPQFK